MTTTTFETAPTKKELRESLRFSKPTFIKKLRILCQDPECPFTEGDIINRGTHWIRVAWANFIFNNLA